MDSVKNGNVPYKKPSREQLTRTVVTSTAIETGQSSQSVEATLKIQRKKFAHLRLAI